MFDAVDAMSNKMSDLVAGCYAIGTLTAMVAENPEGKELRDIARWVENQIATISSELNAKYVIASDTAYFGAGLDLEQARAEAHS
jgi:hypothetical protein